MQKSTRRFRLNPAVQLNDRKGSKAAVNDAHNPRELRVPG